MVCFMNNNNPFALCLQLANLCLKHNVRIALAESCTGGLVSSWITELPGASAWFDGSAVVYSNAAKTALLNVETALLKNQGAVSEPVAKAMAEGALSRFQSMIALSITGVAGPAGGTKEKPVGMVCFALADSRNGVTETKTMCFTSGRSHIRQKAAFFALEWLALAITRGSVL